MGIRLVYGLQTADESYLDIFYPARRLKEAALYAGLDYAAMIFNPSDPASRILDFCNSGKELNTVLLRGELPDSLFGFLESKGIRVINPASAVALARDKLASAEFFRSYGIQHPRTIQPPPYSATLHPKAQQALPLQLPFVAKPRYGKMGRGVVLINAYEDWLLYQAQAAEKDQAIIVQDLVTASIGRDVRFFFADFKARTEAGDGVEDTSSKWICVLRSAPGFLSNAHAGGTMTAFDPPVELQREAERIFALSGLLYGTVDFLIANQDRSSFVVCELNANPGFEELERAMNIDVASAIISAANNPTNHRIRKTTSALPQSVGKEEKQC